MLISKTYLWILLLWPLEKYRSTCKNDFVCTLISSCSVPSCVTSLLFLLFFTQPLLHLQKVSWVLSYKGLWHGQLSGILIQGHFSDFPCMRYNWNLSNQLRIRRIPVTGQQFTMEVHSVIVVPNRRVLILNCWYCRAHRACPSLLSSRLKITRKTRRFMQS